MKKLLSIVLLAALLAVAVPHVSFAKSDYSCTDTGAGRLRLDSFVPVSDTADMDIDCANKKIVEIAADACTYYSDITAVIFPKGLEKIGDRAFCGCDNLKSVVIPDTVMFIGEAAFADCMSLESALIPETVTYIGENVFAGVSDDFKAIVYSGSYAESYCKQNSVEYTEADKDCLHKSYTVTQTVSPTCTQKGKSAKKCSACGKLYDFSDIPAKGHSYTGWNLSDEGRIRECTVCQKRQTQFERGLTAAPFTDINKGQWYYSSVLFCYANGIAAGTSNTTFSPDILTTRAMTVRMLAVYAGAELGDYTSSRFSDVPEGKWYTAAIAWASDKGIVSGYGDRFGPNDIITREQLAAMTRNFASYIGYDTEIRESDIKGFTDKDEISNWAKDSVIWALEQGIIKGTSQNTLSPLGFASRSQVARIIYAFSEAFEPQILPDYDRVVVIGVSGAGAYFKDISTPNIDNICTAKTYSASAELPAKSAENWMSALHGTEASVHGINNENLAFNICDSRSGMPSFLRLVREEYSDCTLASFCSWDNINLGAVEKDIGVYFGHPENSHDDTLTDMLCCDKGYLETNDPKVLFVQYNQCGLAAEHFEGGYGGRDYLVQLQLTDGYIGRIYDKYRELGRLERTLFLIVADHGGIKGTSSHGGTSADETTVFFGAGGYSVNPQADLDTFKNRDTAAVVLGALGIAAPGIYTAQIPDDLFISQK